MCYDIYGAVSGGDSEETVLIFIGAFIMGEMYKDYVTHPDEKGSVNISEEVIAAIAANSALETEGVTSLATAGGSDRRGRKSSQKGVKIYIEDEIIVVDVWLITKMGIPVNSTAVKVQESIKTSIESMTGFSVSEVNVHVCGVGVK